MTPKPPVSRRRPTVALYDAAAVAPYWVRIVVMVVGLFATAFVINLTSSSPGIYSSMWNATVGGSIGLTQVAQLATPLILAGTAVAIGRRVAVWNVGVDGQMIFGAWAATELAYHAGSLPGWLLALLMMLVATVAGAVWALGPALARAHLKVNEVITTLMLNFVAGLWLIYWATGPWETSISQLGAVSTKDIPAGTFLHQFKFGNVSIGLGLFIAIVVALAAAAAFRYLRFGYQAKLASGDEGTARFAGVPQRRIQLTAFLVSGAIGGLAGAVMELDQVHSFSTSLTNNTGYIGLVIAVLAVPSLAGVIPMALLMAIVVAGGNGLSLAGISSDLVLLATGVLLLLGGAADLAVRYRIRTGHSDGSSSRPGEPEPAPGPPVAITALEGQP